MLVVAILTSKSARKCLPYTRHSRVSKEPLPKPDIQTQFLPILCLMTLCSVVCQIHSNVANAQKGYFYTSGVSTTSLAAVSLP